MGRINYAGIGFAVLIAAAVWAPSVQAAGIPVADAPSASNTTKDFLQRVKESKFVMDTVNMANIASAAIGDAKRSVSEYVVKNKEKIEKKLEKVKEYKEQAEEYKKQYDEYKAWVDEKAAKVKEYKEEAEKYKSEIEKGIEQAKEFKEQAEAGIEMAKDAAKTAQQAAGAVKDVAQSKIDNAAGKAGIDLGGSSSGPDMTSSGSSVSSPSVSPNNGGSVPAVSVSGSAGSAVPAVSAPASTRTAFGGATAPAAGLAPTVTENQVPLTDGAVAAAQEAAVIEENANARITNTVEQLQQSPSPEAAETAQQDLQQIKSDSLEELNSIKTESDEQLKAVNEELKAARKEQRQQKKQLKSSTRRSFKTSSLWPDTENSYISVATSGGNRPLAFAFDLSEMGIKLPDGGTDVNGTFIIPRTISMTCGGLSSADAQKKDALDNCLVKEINDKTRGAQINEMQDMTATYIQGKKEFAAAYIAEAFIAANDTTYFVEKIIDPVEDASATTTMDNYSNMVELNKAVATAINGLLKIHSADLALQAYDNYGAYQFMSPEES